MLDYRKLKTLVLMQGKEKIDFSFLQSRKMLLFTLVKKLVLIGLFSAAIYLGLYYGQRFKLFNLVTNYTMVFFVTILLSVSLISCTVTLMKNFYFGKDNFILFSFAVKPNTIFFSKLVLAFLLELNRNITYLAPFFLAYGIVRSYPLIYYVNFIWLFIFLTLAVVVVSAILSLPAMIVTQFVKKVKFLHMIFLIYFGFQFYLIIRYIVSYIPPVFSLVGRWDFYSGEITKFLVAFSKTAFPFNHITQVLVGNNGYFGYKFATAGNLKVLSIGVVVVVIGIILSYTVTRYVFFKMVTNTYDKRKTAKTYKKKVSRQQPALLAEIKKEYRILFRSPALFFQNLIYLVIMPLAILLLNRIFIAIRLSSIGQDMALCFNLLMIVLISLTATSSLATSFGSEKMALFQLKTRPISLFKTILAKSFTQMSLTLISVYVSCRFVYLFQPLTYNNYLLFLMIIILINFAFLFWIIQTDLANPFSSDMLINKAELKSYLLVFLLSLLSFVITLFFLRENRYVAWPKVASAALLLMLLRLFLLQRYSNILYRELGGRC